MMAIKETVFLLLLIMLPVATKAKKAIKPRAWAANFFDAASDSCTDRCNKCCPAGWVLHGSSCYYIEDSKTFSMSVAQQKCRNFGADLAIIRSAEENDFILRLVTEKLNNAYGVWLGLQRKADSKLYWIDGTPLEGHYQNWDIREPNNSGGSENCVNMYRGGSPGKWNDAPCFWALTPSVLCQKSI